MGATLFVQPLDLVKNRMQLSGMAGKREYTSSLHAIRTIVAKEGPLALYNGERENFLIKFKNYKFAFFLINFLKAVKIIQFFGFP